METSRIGDSKTDEGGLAAQPNEKREGFPTTLADRLGAAPLQARDVVELLLAVCELLLDVHGKKLAHANLTPRNLRFRADGQIELDCFPQLPADATFVMHEPKYASPELLLAQTAIEGTGHVLSDIYVLGFMAYEALAGQELFHRELRGAQGGAENELFWMKWHADSGRNLPPLLELNGSIPEELSSIVQRMTKKVPGERFGDLNELQDAVEKIRPRLMATESIEISAFLEKAPPTLLNDAIVGRSRHRLAYLIVPLALIAGSGWWLFEDGNPGSKLAASMHWVERSTISAKARLTGLAQAPMQKSTLELPQKIETASGPMVFVKSGSFVMGSSAAPNEGPARTLYVASFYMDEFEVSNARYRAFTDATGYVQPPAPSWDPDYFAKGSLPVLNVSWRDAQAFCVAAKKRLPSEAEWEKAARGVAPGSRYWANWSVPGLANLKRDGVNAPSPIGSFPADVSPFGVFDMAGNVHEWANDQYGLYSGNRLSLDEAGTAKVVRGGSFALSPGELSPSWRASHEATIADSEDSPIGFRCAADSRLGVDAQRQPTAR